MLRTPERFTDYDPSSPAARAERKWDEREGEIIEQNYNLRRITGGLLLCIICLAGGLTYKCLASSVVPYVVELDVNTGEIRNVGTVKSMNDYQPSTKMTEYFVKQFIKDTRELPLDPVVYKNRLSTAFNFLTTDMARKLQTQLQDEKITDKFGKNTVQVEIVSVVPMEGGKSFQIRWIENELEVSSGGKTITNYTGIVTLERIEAKDEEQLERNPLGLYIADYNYSKDSTKTVNAKK